MPICKCEQCGKEFKKTQFDYNKVKHHFCSRYCSNKNKIKTNNIIYDYENNIAEIILKSGKKALVDLEDVEKVKVYTWRELSNGYVSTPIKRKTIMLHRFILNPPSNKQIDHINHNILDNRKSNLKICTQYENLQNLSLNKRNKLGEKNITFNRKSKRYYVNIQKYNKRKFIGSFINLEDAVNARDEYERNYYGHN